MDRKKMSLLLVSIAIAFLTATFLTASSSLPTDTPLYTLRMEQVSNEMSFLTTEKNDFAYTIENGHILHVDVFMKQCDILFHGPTCDGCETEDFTCPWASCESTCDYTCGTCPNTCGSTCSNTCSNTCPNTCGSTCGNTCPNTCGNTCPNTCWLSCYGTCITC
jgi:hypothetical protein